MILTTYKYIKKWNTNFSVLFQKLENSVSFILFDIIYFSFNYLSLTKPKWINVIGIHPYDFDFYLKDKV